MRGLSEPHNGLWGQGFFTAQLGPIVDWRVIGRIRQVRFMSVSHIKEVAQNLNTCALLSFSE